MKSGSSAFGRESKLHGGDVPQPVTFNISHECWVVLWVRLKREDVPRFTNHLREVVSRDSTICSCVEYNVPGRGPIPFEVSLQSGRFFGQRGEFEFESGISVFVNPRLRVVNDLASSFRLGINGRE